jgi:hypothetical protein
MMITPWSERFLEVLIDLRPLLTRFFRVQLHTPLQAGRLRS